MRVIICGAGQVGINLARYLSEDGHDICVIDQSETLIAQINDSLDVKAVVGEGSSPEILKLAGADDADMMIAVTKVDEVNMIACQVAHSLFGITTKIARIRQQHYLLPEYGDLFHPQQLPIDHVILPELAVAEAIFRRIRISGAFNSIEIPPARVIGVRCDASCPLINTPLRQLTSLFPDLSINVLAINRSGELIIPSSHDQMLEGDNVYFLTDETHITRAMNAFGIETEITRRGIIIGGGNIGFNLAKMMQTSAQGYHLKLIEASEIRAHQVAEQLPDLNVIHGDGLKTDILEEAGLDHSDVAISVTDGDEVNILSSLLCKHLGIKRTISLINKTEFAPLVSRLGVDVIINPREVTASSILQFIRRGRIHAVHSLFDGEAELLAIEAVESSSLIGTSIKELVIPPQTIIGGIIRDNTLVIPRPDTVIEPQDLVILLALAKNIKKIEKLFSVAIGYFN